MKIESKDIFRIAYLITEGFSLAGTKLDESHRVSFIIEGIGPSHGGLLEADCHYRTGKALINPLRLRESLNLLRDIIRGETQNPKKEKSDYGKMKYSANQSRNRSGGSSQEVWSGVEETGPGLDRSVSVP
jgi:hypothetical protein